HVGRVTAASDDGARDNPYPTRSHAAMTTILGLDLGKFKSVSCRYDSKSLEARYQIITTDLDTFRTHLGRLRYPFESRQRPEIPERLGDQLRSDLASRRDSRRSRHRAGVRRAEWRDGSAATPGCL